jgi:hypothetical protein
MGCAATKEGLTTTTYFAYLKLNGEGRTTATLWENNGISNDPTTHFLPGIRCLIACLGRKVRVS